MWHAQYCCTSLETGRDLHGKVLVRFTERDPILLKLRIESTGVKDTAQIL